MKDDAALGVPCRRTGAAQALACPQMGIVDSAAGNQVSSFVKRAMVVAKRMKSSAAMAGWEKSID